MDRNVIVKRIAEIERELCTLRESLKQKTVGDIPHSAPFSFNDRHFRAHRPSLGWVKGVNPTFTVSSNFDVLLAQNNCSLAITHEKTIVVVQNSQVVDDE